MRNYILILLFSLASLNVKSQFLSQSADGKGAVIIPQNGASIGFDIGKSEIAVGANNFNKALDKNNCKLFQNWFFGGNLSVKNSSGLGNLFQSGDIVPAGNLLGFIGFNMNNNESILSKWNAQVVNLKTTLETEKLRQLFEIYRADIASYVQSSLFLIDDATLRSTKGEGFLKKVRESEDAFALRQNIKAILSDDDKRLEDFIRSFRILQEAREKIYIQSFSRDGVTKQIDSAFDQFVKTTRVLRLTPFIFGGIEARNFSWYTGLNPASLPKSFTDTLFRGGHFGVGINGQIGSFWLGITYAYVDGDNFSSLTSKEYNLKTTDTSGNQALTSEKKITGYSGKYAKVENNQLNIDVLKEFRLGDTARLITNLYYRGSLHSRDKDYLQNISNIGLGVYFLGNKSKFLGGLYVELPDVGDNIEEAKPEPERSIRPVLKKLTFGVVTRFSIYSIFGFASRPRNPD